MSIFKSHVDKVFFKQITGEQNVIFPKNKLRSWERGIDETNNGIENKV